MSNNGSKSVEPAIEKVAEVETCQNGHYLEIK